MIDLLVRSAGFGWPAVFPLAAGTIPQTLAPIGNGRGGFMTKPRDIRRGEEITADWLNRSKNAGVHEVRGSGGALVSQSGGNVVVRTPARGAIHNNYDVKKKVILTARTSTEGEFEFAEVFWNKVSGKFEVKTDGVTHETLGPVRATGDQIEGGAGLVYIGDIVTIRPGLKDRGLSEPKVGWEFTTDSKMMPVNVSASGGDAGDEETQCTFTYDVFAQDGETLLSGVSPLNQRPDVGEVKPGSKGYVYYELISGVPTLKLGLINEVPVSYLNGLYGLGTADTTFFTDYNGIGRFLEEEFTEGSNFVAVQWTMEAGDDEVTEPGEGEPGRTDKVINVYGKVPIPDPGDAPDPPYVPDGTSGQILVHDGDRWVAEDPDGQFANAGQVAGSTLTFFGWITLEANTTPGTEIVLNDSDWRGRIIRTTVVRNIDTVANSNAVANWSAISAYPLIAMTGANHSASDLTLFNEGTLLEVVVDTTDATPANRGKLKARATSTGGTNAEAQYVVLIQATAQITAATDTVT